MGLRRIDRARLVAGAASGALCIGLSSEMFDISASPSEIQQKLGQNHTVYVQACSDRFNAARKGVEAFGVMVSGEISQEKLDACTLGLATSDAEETKVMWYGAGALATELGAAALALPVYTRRRRSLSEEPQVTHLVAD